MLLASSGVSGSTSKTYVDDVFSTFLYTGNGGSQTINNGIDLAGKGGLVWLKSRNQIELHKLFDTARGSRKYLRTNAADGEFDSGVDYVLYNSNGFTANDQYVSQSGYTYVSWTFRKALKFFDVVTYTGNGVAGRQIPHGLGQSVGMLIIKRTNASSDWIVWHNSFAATEWAALNTINEKFNNNLYWNNTAPTSSVFSLSADAQVNASGGTYVAYLFAHEPSADGIIQCGSFTTDGSGNSNYNHGWTNGVQFCLVKAASASGDWEIYDTERTSAWSGSDARLRANLLNAEDNVSRISASGSTLNFAGLSASTTYIAMFIAAP